MNKKYRGILLVVLGVVMVLAGVGLYAMNERQDEMAGQNADILLNDLVYEIRFSDTVAEPFRPDVDDFPVTDVPQSPVEDMPAASEPTAAPAMATRTLSGYDLIGILRAPTVGVELPVLSKWSYPLLNVAPCRYSGSLEDGNLIILGHNYKSHLQPLERIKEGDAVEFSDVNGVVYRYVVAAVESIHESDSDLLASQHPLVIFTCTRDGSHRIVVRCDPASQ